MTNHFDYIIVGAGCAGLSLAVRIANTPALAGKKLLLIDKEPKTKNDRTWCFWEKGDGYFENIVHHRWKQLWVRHPKGTIDLELGGYQYKLIRGIDFYRNAFAELKKSPQVKILFGNVENIDATTAKVIVDGVAFTAAQIFSSILLSEPSLRQGQHYLLQHFKGWWIEATADCFDETAADLMNFNTSQHYGTAFMYMLPVSNRRALIEHTLFTADTLQDEAYNQALKEFIATQLGLTDYRITETEFGIIPMTNMQFPRKTGKLCFIGTAGGQTKASTGYTFQFIQKHSEAIVQNLLAEKEPGDALPAGRFAYYDSVLLNVLVEGKLPGDEVFLSLFLKNKAKNILAFLDNDTSFLQELRIMNSTSKSIFIPAALSAWRNR